MNYRDKMMTPDGEYPGARGRAEIAKRLMSACELLQYGTITIEVVGGVPKIVTTIHQTLRLDLTDPAEDGIIKTNQATHHNDGEAKPSSSS